MGNDSFVAYNSYKNNGNERFIVAIGHCGSYEETQFIEIEYTDNGEIIHFYDSSNKELKEKFQTFRNQISKKDFECKCEFFYGNEKLKRVLESYQELGCNYIHKPDCNCVACDTFKGSIFRNNTIERVISELSDIQ